MSADDGWETDSQDAHAFRRQRWTGWLGLVIGGPFGLLLLIGGIADRVPAVVVAGLGLMVVAAVGTKPLRGDVVLELDDEGFVDHRAGVRISWAEVEGIRPRVHWWRFYRLRFLDVDLRDPSVVADRVTSRAGRFVVRQVPGGSSGHPSLGLNVIASDANDVLEAFERRSGKRIPHRFTFTGLRST